MLVFNKDNVKIIKIMKCKDKLFYLFLIEAQGIVKLVMRNKL